MNSLAGEAPKKPRTLILCFDGTSNEYSDNNTNIVKLFALFKKDDFCKQLCYYQPGIGTWFNPGVVAPIFRWGAELLDEAFALYLDAHVIGGYRFLMQNYRVGDKICIFGFSRGAYTARALAGALHKVGLLPRDNEQQIPFAYKLYKRDDNLCPGYKRTFCQNVTVEFMGVWDTVSSIGVIMGRTLPETDLNPAIIRLRHALALDEHRVKFRPNYYHQLSPDQTAGTPDSEQGSLVSPKSIQSEIWRFATFNFPDFLLRIFKWPTKADLDRGKDNTDVMKDNTDAKKNNTDVKKDVKEVWFVGCHSDVGGGSVPGGTYCLGDVSLRWMVQEIMNSPQCGIVFDKDALKHAHIPNYPPMFSDFTENPPEYKSIDEVDALEPIDDQLKRNILWWILEIIPWWYTWQDSTGVWHKGFGFHLGKGRHIPGPEPNFHITVKERMKSSLKYISKARWTRGTEVYVY